MLIDTYILEKADQIDQRLKKLIPIDPSLLQSELFEAANYSLHSGGKRLRPILLLALLDTFNEDSKKGLDVACAIEMVHTYSLIHDDLPCMDNDDMRRNKPSLHKAFSPWLALLTGDYLLTYSFEVIANSKLSDAVKTKIISLLASRIGAYGLIGGQYVDLKSENELIDWQKLKFMHVHKTASLFSLCLECGAIILNRNENEIRSFYEFGKNLGFAYQIMDDISDFKTASDEKKATAVSLIGLKDAQKEVQDLFENALSILKSLKLPSDLLKNLAYKLLKRKT